ncbi:hypothetical protein BDZ89DRAFT_1108771 [Hymenopellis radicata]|nr:hypothetical protein BDZ89DRAFT_1108771 [Hymenopellis radicata]
MTPPIISRLRRSHQNEGESERSVYDQHRWNKSSLHLNISTPGARAPTSSSPPLGGSPNARNSPSSGERISPNPSLSSGRPSNLAWLSLPNGNGEQVVTRLPILPPPTAHRQGVPMNRTVSLPTSSSRPPSASFSNSSLDFLPDSSAFQSYTPSPNNTGFRPGVHRLQMNGIFSRSTQSLDARAGGRAHKPLSPIVEQDYFSPESLRRTRPLPSLSSSGLSPVSPSSGKTTTPGGASEITRPSPVLSQLRSPFLSRSLNRTGSQSSSGTTRSVTPPSIPPLDLRPPFPGPHPSASYDEIPPLRPRLGNLPTIEGSVSDYIGSEASLHADSFFTASDSLHEKEDDLDIGDDEPEPVRLIRPLPRRQPVLTHVEVPRGGGLVEFPSMEDIPRARRASQPPSPPSVSESFIARRWDRSPDIPPVTFPPKPKPSRFTPAFWAFWLGFICPILWLVGGYHFTTFGEPPAHMSLAEFYFNLGYLKAVYCCLYRKRREWAGSGGKGKPKGKKDLVLPRWVDEKREYYDAEGLDEAPGLLIRLPIRAPPASAVASTLGDRDAHNHDGSTPSAYIVRPALRRETGSSERAAGDGEKDV